MTRTVPYLTPAWLELVEAGWETLTIDRVTWMCTMRC